MSITANANRIRVESSAKNGTLGSQSGLNANQIKFDTSISTNNGNLQASPTFLRRQVLLRRGESNAELRLVTNTNPDGVTVRVNEDWDEAPASGDSYDVAYTIGDVETMAGCNFETDSRQWTLSKRLIIGDGTNYALLGLSNGQIVRFDDRGPTQSALRVSNAAAFHIGAVRNDKPRNGAILIFTNDASGETVAEFVNGSFACLNNFVMCSARRPDGVKDLKVTVGATANMDWRDAELYGVDAPFKKQRERFKTQVYNEVIGTVGDVKNSPEYIGYAGASFMETFRQLLANETDTEKKVRIVIEDA